MPVPPAFLPGAMKMAEKDFQARSKLFLAQAEKLICQLKGSCSPKFQQAVASVGIAGYRRGSTTAFEFYLNNGLNLTQDLTKKHNYQAWYFGSGYWEKLKNTGLDNCCLKQKHPPSEAFPLINSVLPKAVWINLPSGDQVAVDPDRFDPNNYQMELDEYFKKTGNIPSSPIVNEIPKNTSMETPIVSGQALLPLLLLFALPKGGS